MTSDSCSFFNLRHCLCSAYHPGLFWAGCIKLRFSSQSARLADAASFGAIISPVTGCISFLFRPNGVAMVALA
jgi:hypothetical protein